jgi:hypothetical protein
MTSYLGVVGTLLLGGGAEAWMRMRQLTAFRRQAAKLPARSLGFRTAERVRTYRDYPAEGGTTRYDDVWGG